jgi:hypothetical protein
MENTIKFRIVVECNGVEMHFVPTIPTWLMNRPEDYKRWWAKCGETLRKGIMTNSAQQNDINPKQGDDDANESKHSF